MGGLESPRRRSVHRLGWSSALGGLSTDSPKPTLPSYNESRMPFYQKPLVILAAALILPPAGMVLLWLRKGVSILKKALVSLPILGLGIAHLFLFYGLQMELMGGMRPTFYFGGAARRYRVLEESRAAQKVQPPAAGSTYWTVTADRAGSAVTTRRQF